MEWDRNGMGTEQFNPFAESKYSGTLLTSEITIHLTTMITEILCWENGGQGLLLPHLYQDGPESRKQIDSRETLKRWMINDLNEPFRFRHQHQDSMRFKKILGKSRPSCWTIDWANIHHEQIHLFKVWGELWLNSTLSNELFLSLKNHKNTQKKNVSAWTEWNGRLCFGKSLGFVPRVSYGHLTKTLPLLYSSSSSSSSMVLFMAAHIHHDHSFHFPSDQTCPCWRMVSRVCVSPLGLDSRQTISFIHSFTRSSSARVFLVSVVVVVVGLLICILVPLSESKE